MAVTVPERFGKYRVLRKIASGGMSEVYLCLLPGEGGFRKRVALKVAHPRHADDSRFRDLFIREARLAASLSHPNLIQVFDFGKEGNVSYLAMEYVEGYDLAQAAAQARLHGVSIPPGVWRLWVEGIWSGLGHLHEKGIVHRDVSPGNVLLGRTGAVKLTDFGISRDFSESDEGEGSRAGKAAYLSPERARGEAATPASDLFAAAVISAELLLGRRLFEGGGTEEVLERVRRFDGGGLEYPGAEKGIAVTLRAALSQDPAIRFPSASDFLAALAERGPARASAPQLAIFWDALFPRGEEEETTPSLFGSDGTAPSMVKEPPPGYGMRRRTLQAFAAAAFAALAAGGVFLLLEKREPGRPISPSAVSTPRREGADGDGGQRPEAAPPRATASTPPHAASAEKAPAVGAEPTARRFVRIETDPEGANILLGNGKSAGRTPSRLDPASVGGRGIVLARDGYERKSVPADALAMVATYRTELDPILGTVEAIQAIPWAKVYVDGRFLGETPLTSVRLPVGEHRLRFVNEPLGVDKAEAVVVRPGNNPKVIVRMAGAGLP